MWRTVEIRIIFSAPGPTLRERRTLTREAALPRPGELDRFSRDVAFIAQTGAPGPPTRRIALSIDCRREPGVAPASGMTCGLSSTVLRDDPAAPADRVDPATKRGGGQSGGGTETDMGAGADHRQPPSRRRARRSPRWQLGRWPQGRAPRQGQSTARRSRGLAAEGAPWPVPDQAAQDRALDRLSPVNDRLRALEAEGRTVRRLPRHHEAARSTAEPRTAHPKDRIVDRLPPRAWCRRRAA